MSEITFKITGQEVFYSRTVSGKKEFNVQVFSGERDAWGLGKTYTEALEEAVQILAEDIRREEES